MRPINTIKPGQWYSNPLHRGFGAMSGIQWVVLEVNAKEKMVLVQPCNAQTLMEVKNSKPVWLSNRHRMFSIAWEI